MEKINLAGEEWAIEDVIERVCLVDSFVLHKLAENSGHGESRLYIGAQRALDWKVFFEGFSLPGIFLKSDFEKYMLDAKTEYQLQEQGYKKDISQEYKKRLQIIQKLPTEITKFDFGPQNGKKDKSRYYVGSSNKIWQLMRKVALPRITYFSLIRLRNAAGEKVIYFRLFIDYEYDSRNHPGLVSEVTKGIEAEHGTLEEKKAQTNAREGQGRYRESLLGHMQSCPITQVSDERMLIASHIKPWAISDSVERVDRFNGFMFTPNIDRLFDQGFITFRGNKSMAIAPWISPMNKKRLGLIDDKIYPNLPLEPEREKYMEYHRREIFKGKL